MTKRDIATLAVKILSIYLCFIAITELIAFVIQGLTMVLTTVCFTEDHEKAYYIMLAGLLGVFVSLIIKLVIGVFLWFAADWFSLRITGKNSEANVIQTSHIDSKTILYCAFMVVGLVFMIDGGSDIASHIGHIISANYHASQYADESNNGSIRIISGSPRMNAVFFSGTMKFVVGIWLLLGSRGIVEFVHHLRGGITSLRKGISSLRTMGTDKPE